MKRVMELLITALVAVGLYLPCRELAVLERGNEAFGGEVLVPVLVFIAYAIIKDAFKEETE